MDYFVELYKNNEQFKVFVDKCARANKEAVEQTLERLTVREVGRYYVEREKDRVQTQTIITAGCGGAC